MKNLSRSVGVAVFGLFVAGLLAVPMTQAAVITYDYTAAGGHFGSFSFDDTNTTTVAAPPGFNPAASFYGAIGFDIDGVAVASPIVAIYHNVTGLDCADAGSALGLSAGLLEVCAAPPTLFSSQALSELDNRQLSDFNFSSALAISLVSTALLTLTERSSVPEPATLALLGVGLAGLGFSRRKR